MGAETAILASTISSAFSLATLIISRIKCYYERTEDGCAPKCACMDHPILSDDHEIEITESKLNDTSVLIISKNHKKNIYSNLYMPPKSKFTETDEKALTWIYNYVKSLAGYEDAKKEDFMYKYNKKLLTVINQHPRWQDGSKQRAYFTVAKWLSINNPNLKIIEEYRERGFALKTTARDGGR